MTIVGLLGGLWLTFRIMARASLAYEKARQARDSEIDKGSGHLESQSQGPQRKEEK
ncbi:MAG: hypothetical protein H0V77_02495 [Actinobacteria bacterium]|nr:hypothetical protein [Actinomycetota bacterium]MDQ3218069.1 hypothetical protein [Actinomycetota bacterium]